MKFTEFGFDDRLLDGIDASNYDEATPVQAQVIPLILEGRDIIASAQTGTGKTAAFLLPLINKIITAPQSGDGITSLVIVPTRELAIQIAQHLEGLSYFTSISSIAVFGGGDGNAFVQEKKALSMGADIVVCTPGKMMAHIKMGYVKLNQLKYLVLDEADRMLDMGFFDDIMFIIKHLPEKRQNLLFSATMPPKIRQLARTILTNPAEINISISKPPEKIIQQAYMVYDAQKNPLIIHLLKENHLKKVVIFCSSKLNVKQLTRDLKKAGIKAGEIHSDLEQESREDILMQYRSGRLPVLVATDILSRGIDIDNIELVINFDVPHDGEDYVHRIGRTARAEADGTAFTLVSVKEQRKFLSIEKLLEKEVPKMPLPEIFGEQPAYNPVFEKRSSGGKKRSFQHKGTRNK
ncbi:DEAD/DEAH box helicase [Ferruginibacter sp. HRS2-29]|uniref:DEAD/DEAH box helicase n=1 Tax=Ferruginibacter sp. HRS2-29 TaxID=2487334 RepID=UPI0020CF6894|nr:DEAD/DEAH box helicase [Ferruginibacter sp. HRS2-29]MCP9750266.1 DEAD/DEAH box helicase [Ferruginibacter sp. HRS2-29]